VIGIVDEQAKDSIDDHDEELEKLRAKVGNLSIHAKADVV
jgi:hypothetical protein